MYEVIIDAQRKLTQDSRGRVYSYVISDAQHKQLFFATRYSNIHRLMTHCNNRPKMFKCEEVRIYTTKGD